MKQFLLALLMLASTATNAEVSINVSPAAQVVAVASPVIVDLNISGLTSGVALGTFDILFSFDSALLAPESYNFGNQLDLFGFGDIQSLTFGDGTVRLFELSLESVIDLNYFQAQSFRLASITFIATAQAMSTPLQLSINALGDASGGAIAANVIGGSVTITSVPEPTTYALMLGGLGLLLRCVRIKSGQFRCDGPG